MAVAVVLIAGCRVAVGGLIVAEPDAYPADTILDIAFENLYLSRPFCFPYPPGDEHVHSETVVDPMFASTGTRVFANSRSGEREGQPLSQLWHVGNNPLCAMFSHPVSHIAIDVIAAPAGSYPDNTFGAMLAFDEGGNELAYTYSGLLENPGDIATLEFDDPPVGTAYVLIGGWFDDDIILDNLQVECTPEPSTIVLLTMSSIMLLRRRKM